MSDIVKRLHEVNMRWWREPEHAVVVEEAADEIERLNSDLSDALTDLNTARQDNASCTAHIHNQAAEIERLRAGGCARDQTTTQYCAEAERLAADNETLRAEIERLQKISRAALEKST